MNTTKIIIWGSLSQPLHKLVHQAPEPKIVLCPARLDNKVLLETIVKRPRDTTSRYCSFAPPNASVWSSPKQVPRRYRRPCLLYPLLSLKLRTHTPCRLQAPRHSCRSSMTVFYGSQLVHPIISDTTRSCCHTIIC